MFRAPADHTGVRVLAVADSDSYLKWAAGTLDTLPASWERRLSVVRSPIAPSRDQARAALSETASSADPPAVLTVRALRRFVDTYRPDALLLACTGPVVAALTDVLPLGAGNRPVVVSGLPGIAVPASSRVWRYRWKVDLLVVHSRAEVRAYAEMGRTLGTAGRVGLMTLPFLTGRGPSPAPPDSRAPVHDRVVFAAQALAPASRPDRERILQALAALAERRPDLRVVVKLRAAAGEMQTHRERHPYPALWRDLAASGQVRAGSVRFETGPMRAHLERAAALVTVGSTAALEAIDAGVPLLVLTDAGASCHAAFEGSGCLGTLADLGRADFRYPRPGWSADNYLHEPEANDWQDHVADLAGVSRAGRLASVPAPPPTHRPPVRPGRSRIRLMVPPGPYRGAVRVGRQITHGLRSATTRD